VAEVDPFAAVENRAVKRVAEQQQKKGSARWEMIR
jgi:hypothetical protein